MSPDARPVAARVSLAALPPDPSWRNTSCWPAGVTIYITWDHSDENESIPLAVRDQIASALCNIGLVVFLGGFAKTLSSDWRRVDGGWSAVSKKPLDWLLGRTSLRLMASRAVDTVKTLFDQEGFDWSLQAQAAFVLEDKDPVKPILDAPDRFASCLESDRPHGAPTGCLAILRPGTDGDFAEFHAASQRVADKFKGYFDRG